MFSKEPQIVGKFDIECNEVMRCQYLPIKMAGSHDILVPESLSRFNKLIVKVALRTGLDEYLYLTAKHKFVPKGSYPNRPGWHIDGFGTNDTNFIWCDTVPTEFCIQDFDLSDDHNHSMIEMEEQVQVENIKTYDTGCLLRLDNTIVHRVAVSEFDHFRTFVKLSVSKEKYNLVGNSHNYMFDYNWNMVEREETRNHPIK